MRQLAAIVLVAALAVTLAAEPATAEPTVPPDRADRVPTEAPATTDDRVADPEGQLGAGWRESSDRAVTSYGDSSGLHILVADRADAYRWRTVATLAEPHWDTDQWIGQMCTSGDGDKAVVVYAPRAFTNRPTLMERGGFAAVVDLVTGEVTKLKQRVTLAYYNPSCGASTTAVVSRLEQSLKEGEPATTWIGVVDTRAGSVRSERHGVGQLSSSTPVGNRIVAAKGHSLVEVGADGEVTRLVDTDGEPHRLMPEGSDGLAFQVADGDDVTLARWDGNLVESVRTVPKGAVRLRPGAGGDVYAIGTRAAELLGDDAPDQWRTVDAYPDSEPSTEGALLVTRTTNGQEPAGQLTEQLVTPDDLPVAIEAALLASDRSTVQEALEFTVEAGDAPAGRRDGRWSGSPIEPSAESASPLQQTDYSTVPWDPDRACAAPRNDPTAQSYQPGAAEMEWAINLAVRGELTGQRPENWLNSGLPSYSPQGLFPSLSLAGGGHVPAQILLAIIAQESNLYQASWRVVDGLAGNPLTSAGFYGLHWENPDPRLMDWEGDVDCGFGAGQVTTGMLASDTGTVVGGIQMTYTRQQAVAQDFAVNIAASLRILQEKWNETYNAGLIANNGDPRYLENWWFAIWAYNSGFYPRGGGGQWGVGWSNNPASPLYPADRRMFLTAPLAHPDVDPPDEVGYDNARHPNHWSYPERVLGFAYTSLRRWDYRDQYYRETYRPATMNASTEFAQPDRSTFCTTTVNQCSFSAPPHQPGDFPGYPAGPCLRDDLRCWWNAPVSWGAPNCGDCGTEIRTYTAGSAAPPRANPIYSAPCQPQGLPSNARIVNNLNSAAPHGPHGCSRTWGNHGEFEMEFGGITGPQGDRVFPSKVDLHQINGGFGGHFWMTHQYAASYMRVIGRWRFSASINGHARVWVHLPDHGARTLNARYTIRHAGGSTVEEVRQYGPGNRWVEIGSYRFDGQPVVELTNWAAGNEGDMSVAFDAVAIEPTPLEDQCYGDGAPPYTQSCNGKDPQVMGCGADAERVESSTSASNVHLELRYSPRCNAYWTRYTNNGGGTGRAIVRAGNHEQTRDLAAYRGETGWTNMVPAGSDPRACLWFYLDDTWGYVTHCTSYP